MELLINRQEHHWLALVRQQDVKATIAILRCHGLKQFYMIINKLTHLRKTSALMRHFKGSITNGNYQKAISLPDYIRKLYSGRWESQINVYRQADQEPDTKKAIDIINNHGEEASIKNANKYVPIIFTVHTTPVKTPSTTPV